MKFGIIKSRIEKKLTESYQKGKFEFEVKNLKKLVLENKKISTLFFIYNELSSNKGLKDKETANEYINECIKIYENTSNKLTNNDLKKLIDWVGNIVTENEYHIIDDLLTSNTLQLESKIESKKIIVETLIKQNKETKNEVNLPIKTLVNVANNTIEKYISKLDENTKQELQELFSSNDDSLKTNYESIKEEVLFKLDKLKLNTDTETKNKIMESMEKIKTERFDKLNLYRLKTLNENI